MRRLKWMVKQLLPFTYRSHYSEGNKKVFVVWNMWFGECYNIESCVCN